MATVSAQLGLRLELGEATRKRAMKRANVPVQLLLDFSWHFEVPNTLRPDFDKFDHDKLAAHEAALIEDIGSRPASPHHRPRVIQHQAHQARHSPRLGASRHLRN